jgi:hypothetical protein
MAKALKHIAEKIDRWSSGTSRLKIETLTQNEQAEIDRQLQERVVKAREARKNAPGD